MTGYCKMELKTLSSMIVCVEEVFQMFLPTSDDGFPFLDQISPVSPSFMLKSWKVLLLKKFMSYRGTCKTYLKVFHMEDTCTWPGNLRKTIEDGDVGKQKEYFHTILVYFLSMYLLWLHCLFLVSLKFNCLQCVFLNEKIDDNCWNIDHVLQTTWKWSSWRLAREQDGANVTFISDIHVHFLSCVICFIVLPTLPSPSSTVFLRFPTISEVEKPLHTWLHSFLDRSLPVSFRWQSSA